MTSASPYVYAITDGHFIKIGVARRPNKRLKNLATGNVNSLTMLGYFHGGFELEKKIHREFKQARGEWMVPTEALLTYLNGQITDKHIVVIGGEVKHFPKMINVALDS